MFNSNHSYEYVFIELTDMTGLTMLVRTDTIIKVEQEHDSSNIRCKVFYIDGTSDYVQESIDDIANILAGDTRRQLNE